MTLGMAAFTVAVLLLATSASEVSLWISLGEPPIWCRQSSSAGSASHTPLPTRLADGLPVDPPLPTASLLPPAAPLVLSAAVVPIAFAAAVQRSIPPSMVSKQASEEMQGAALGLVDLVSRCPCPSQMRVARAVSPTHVHRPTRHPAPRTPQLLPLCDALRLRASHRPVWLQLPILHRGASLCHWDCRSLVNRPALNGRASAADQRRLTPAPPHRPAPPPAWLSPRPGVSGCRSLGPKERHAGRACCCMRKQEPACCARYSTPRPFVLLWFEGCYRTTPGRKFLWT